MQAQERELIAGLYERLRQFESQARDPEAERLIAELVSRQPSSAYLLTQTVLVQEEALKAAQARIAELEAKTSGNSGFLASAPSIGPWGAKPSSAVPQTVAPPAQPQRGPGVFNQAGGGGGFMRSALATAAGVAGGALLFEGIRSMFGRNEAQAAPLLPSEQFRPVDLSQDDGASGDYDTSDDSSGFDGGGSDDL
jgi:hypothetical protein